MPPFQSCFATLPVHASIVSERLRQAGRSMDNTIEMVSSGALEVEDAHDLDEIPSKIPAGNTRRKFAGTCAVLLLLAIAVACLAKVYLSPDQLTAADQIYTAEEGTIGNDVGSATEAELKDELKDHTGHDAAEQFIENHGGKDKEEHKEITKEEKIQKWLDANVTLSDGKQYEVIKQLKHSSDAFTEGLTFLHGRLFESTGLRQHSLLSELDVRTGEVKASYPLKSSVFGEGLAALPSGKLVQLTYKAHEGYVYDLQDLSTPSHQFKFDTTRGEGWGMTYDRHKHQLIVSDGSKYLHFWDADNFTETHKVAVTLMDGKDAYNINELEWWRNRILANVWFKDVILVINPETGQVEKEYDFQDLWPKAERKGQGADVLNGISVVGNKDHLLVTGKNWDRMFRVKLLP